MKIRTKLIVLYVLGASLTTVMAAFAIRSYRIVETDFKLVVEDSIKKIELLKQIERSGVRIVSITNEYSLVIDESRHLLTNPAASGSVETGSGGKERRTIGTQTDESRDQLVNEGLKRFYEALNEYEDLTVGSASGIDPALEKIRANGNLLIEISAELLTLRSSRAPSPEILKKQSEFSKAKADFLDGIEASQGRLHGELSQRKQSVEDTISQSTQNTLIISALAFVFALLGGGLFSRTVTIPLRELRNATRLVGDGQLQTEVNISSNDEVGELADDFRKMTEKLRGAHEDLLASKNFTENVISSMADMLITVDDNGVIQSVNEAFLRHMGYRGTDVIGKPIGFLTRTSAFFTDEEFAEMSTSRVLTSVEKEMVTSDGKRFLCEISSSILRDHDLAAVVVAKDISQRIEDERQLRAYSRKLEQSNRELQDFAYVASHDLQEPLRKVQAFGDRLSRKYGDKLGEEGNDYIRRMRDASKRMQTLINDLLTFSRVTTKAQPFQHVDISTIANEVVSDLEVRIDETQGRVEIGELPSIDADPVQMRQLMQNLIGNALKFHRPEEKPLIRVYSNDTMQFNTGSFSFNGEQMQTQGVGDRHCQIIVQDNGIGFDEKYLDRIFTVFQRLHGRTEYEGSGVGLAVCRKIVERHGGSITAESKPGEGAKFVISLPVAQNSKEIKPNETRL